MLGVLGGMGPAATVDFLAKLVALTPARRDQEHLPVLAGLLPQVPDRSAAILGQGPSPLPALRHNLELLLRGGAQAVAIPCNSSHHWHEALQAECPVPILHIAQATLTALADTDGPVLVLATRGCLQSGFYQRHLEARGLAWRIPDAEGQVRVDQVIALVKGGDAPAAARLLDEWWQGMAGQVGSVIMGCTEIPLAAARGPAPPFRLVDSNLELARASVAHGLLQGWLSPAGAAAHG